MLRFAQHDAIVFPVVGKDEAGAMMEKQRASGIYYCLLSALLFAACGKAPAPGTVKDEALTVGRMANSFPAADENYFKEMDGGVDLTANEVKGRNNWIVWTGGSERFWGDIAHPGFCAGGFLKII